MKFTYEGREFEFRGDYTSPKRGEYFLAYNGLVSKAAFNHSDKFTNDVRAIVHPVEKPTLQEAVKELYYAAVWHADRDVDEFKLWEAVRDAAGFEKGNAPTKGTFHQFGGIEYRETGVGHPNKNQPYINPQGDLQVFKIDGLYVTEVCILLEPVRILS